MTKEAHLGSDLFIGIKVENVGANENNFPTGEDGRISGQE
jgi:hypothetical protein